MKLETGIIIVKAFCYALIGAGTPMIGSLAQWANSDQWPGRIQWVVIIIGACVGGATQMLSFMSGSYSDYMIGRKNGNGNGNGNGAAYPAKVLPTAQPAPTIPAQSTTNETMKGKI